MILRMISKTADHGLARGVVLLKPVTLILLIATLIAVIYLIVGVRTGMLAVPFKTGIPVVGPWTRTPHYPWTDMAENIVVAFNLANGARFGHETIVVHMPGLPQYLAMFLHLTGVAKGTASQGLLSTSYAVSALGISIFQMSCLFAALRISGFSTIPAALTGFCLLLVSAFVYDIIMPMSENVVPFIFLLQFTLFLKILVKGDNAALKPVYAAWALTFLPLINLLAGLTLAPSVAFLWLATVIVSLGALQKIEARAWSQGLKQVSLWVPLILSATVIGYEIAVIDFQALWFWNFSVPAAAGIISPLATMQDAFSAQWLWDFQTYHLHFIGGTLLEFIVACLLLFLTHRPSSWSEFTNMLGLIFVASVAMVLSFWRFNIGYKSEAACGLTWAILFWAAVHLWPQLKGNSDRVPLHTVTILVTALGSAALALLFLWYLSAMDIYAQRPPPRLPVLDSANVCRLRSTAPCRCLQSTVYGPQSFMQQDVRQCVDRYSTFAAAVFRNPEVRNRLLSDLERNDVAFIVFPPHMLNIDEKDRDPRVIKAFYEGGLHCDDYAGIAKLCYNP
jgi:hypothetical protein